MQLYVDRFDRRNCDGVRELISADARLGVADRFAGNLRTRLISSITTAGPGPGNWPWVKWTVNRRWSFSDGVGHLDVLLGHSRERDRPED